MEHRISRDSWFSFAIVLLLVTLFIFVAFQGCTSKYNVKSSKYPNFQGEINQHSRLIDADRHHIFEIITNANTFKQICPKGTIVTYELPLPYQVGTTVKTRIEHIFKLEWHTQVKEIIPDRKIRLQFVDGFFKGGAEIWELDDREGQTQVTHTIIVQPKGLIRKFAWLTKVRLKHDKMVEIFLDNLKKVSESK